MKRNFLYTTCFLLTFVNTYSQFRNTPFYFKDFPQTPSAAAFQRYGEIQNAEYIGANSPMIPLFTVEEGDISFPLNLNYVSGNGVKVRDEASSVGLGWGIPMATITQYVQGGFDDFGQYEKLKFDFLYDSTPPFIRNKFEVCMNSAIPPQYLNQLDYNKYTYYKSMRNMLPIGGYFKDYNLGFTEYDTSPDIFICNLFGEKIEFMTSNFETILYPNSLNFFNARFESLNKKGFKIEYNTTDLFIITNPAGTKYYFSKVEETGVGATNNGTTFVSSVKARNYVVTKIVDKNSRTVTINYKENLEPGAITPYAQHLNLTLASDNYTHNDSLFPPNSFYAGECRPSLGYGGEYNGSYGGDGYSSMPYQSSETVGEYRIPNGFHLGYYTKNLLLVSDIIGDFGKISFEYSGREDWTQSNKLDKILMQNNVSQITKKIAFNYSYFDSQNSKTLRTEAANLNIQTSNFPITNIGRFTKRLKLNSIIINDTDEFIFKYNPTLLPDKDSFAVDYWGYFNGSIGNNSLFPNPTDFNFTLNGGTNVPLIDKNNNVKKANLDFAKAGILERITYPTKGYANFDYELNTADNLFVDEYPSTITSGNGLRLKRQANYDSNDQVLGQTIFEYEGGKSHNPLDLFKKTTTRLISGANSSFNSFTTYNYTTLTMLAVSDNTSSPLSTGGMVGYSTVSKKEIDNNISKGKIVTYYSNIPEGEYQFKDDKEPVYFPKIKSKTDPDNGTVSGIKIFDSNNILVKEIENIYSNSLSKLFYGSSLILYNSTAYTNGCVIASSCVYNGTYQSDLVGNAVTLFSFYPIFSKQSLLQTSKSTEYLNNKPFVTKMDYTYDSNNLVSQKQTTTPDLNYFSEGTVYSSIILRFRQANILSENTSKHTIKNGKPIYMQSNKYDDPNHFNPTSIITNTLEDPNVETPPDARFDKYNAKGELLQYTTKEGSPVTIIWGYKQTQPIAKIEGGTYSQVIQAMGLDPNDSNSYLQLNIVKKSDLDVNEASEITLINELDNFRKKQEFKDFKITTYTYDPLIGVKTITAPSGFREFYKYNASNRLERILDKEGNIIKESKYNFAPTKYYSAAKSLTFTRNNCGSNAVGGTYTYTLPEGKYTSIVSQEDADQKAQNDVNANGQNQANALGSCTPVVDCGFTPAALISSNMLGKSVKKTANKIDVSLVFSPKDTNNNWYGTTLIGNIPNPTCRPSGTINLDYSTTGKSWYITTKADGSVLITLTQGTVNNTQFIPPIDIIYSFSN